MNIGRLIKSFLSACGLVLASILIAGIITALMPYGLFIILMGIITYLFYME